MMRKTDAIACAWLAGCALDLAPEDAATASAETTTSSTGIVVTEPTGTGDLPRLDLGAGSPCGELGLSSIW
ncbi:MAG TPA: hypothetical protein VIK91_12910, partial [Nannocystis sp.]